ncbi:MAG: ComEC/Rec2 family competence protein [Patescibacteria group bacterium]
MTRIRQQLIFILPVALLVANVFAWQVVWRETPRGILTVAFLDIGQGDAIYIEAPNGNQVLVDGGGGRQILRALGEVMPFYDHSLDVVIATHPDADHIGGLSFVLDRFAVGAVLEPGVESDTNVYQEFKRRVDDGLPRVAGGPPCLQPCEAGKAGARLHTLARRGLRLRLDREVTLDILFPDQDPTTWETNTASIVARLVYGDTAFLLTGDSPIKIEKYLLARDGKNLQADVLKAGHHGSRTSTAPEYAAAVKPQYAVISAGKNNRYGHPHREVLDTLTKLGATILRTDEAGTIIMQTDGKELRVK